MDDLYVLGNLLAEPEPSQDAVDRSRRRLHETMRGPVRGPRTGWLAVGLALTAAAAAAAVVIASYATAPTATPNSPPAVTRLSGRQVLLVAAATAESEPARSGTYWHVRTVFKDARGAQITELWKRHDGQAWISLKPGMVSKLPAGNGFSLGGTGIRYDQIQRLPTEPDELKAALVRRSRPRVPASALVSLTGVLYAVPAPPKVRAAAFRALAALPNIKNLGAVQGGQLLVLSDGEAGSKIVINPATSRLVSAEGFTSFDGESMGIHTFTAEWTDRLPGKVVPLKRQAHGGS
jgi:hypothetical protein